MAEGAVSACRCSGVVYRTSCDDAAVGAGEAWCERVCLRL